MEFGSNNTRYQKGFTLIEILLGIAMIAVLITATVVYINPGRNIAQTSNAERIAEAEDIYEAIQRYAVDNQRYPERVRNLADSTELEICAQGVSQADCISNSLLILEDVLVPQYLDRIPLDPSLADGSQNTGYTLHKDANGKIGVRADNMQLEVDSYVAGVPADPASVTGDPGDIGGGGGGAGSWFGTYGFRRTLTLESDLVAGGADFANFPVFVSITETDLATTGNGGDVTSSDGFDIVFTDSSNTQLAHEIESYNPVTGAIAMWVNVTALGASTDTEIRMYYGDATVSTSQEDVANVWDADYVAVWHMSEDPTSTADGSCGGGSFALCDSSGNNFHLTDVSGGNLTSVVGGVGNAVDFPGNNNNRHVTATGLDTVLNNSTGLTVEVWVNSDSATANRGIISGQFDSVDLSPLNLRYDVAGFQGGGLNVIKGWEDHESANNAQTDVLQNIVKRWSANLAEQMVIDGALDIPTATYGNSFSEITGINSTTYIGRGGNSDVWQGTIEEVRISTVARSVDWITTGYNNVASPGTGSGAFISAMGVEEVRP